MSENGVHVSCEMIIRKGDKILMGKRGNVFGKGSWAFPGGHVEKGEKVEESMKRELMEELDIVPTKFELIMILNDIPNTQENQVEQAFRFIFLIDEYNGEIVNKEPDRCGGWEWFEKDKLPEPIFVGHEKYLKLFLEGNKQFFIQQ